MAYLDVDAMSHPQWPWYLALAFDDVSTFSTNGRPNRCSRRIRRAAAFQQPGQRAIKLIAEQSNRGFTHLAVAWPAFWVLDCYRDVAEHLADHHQLLTTTDDVVLYRLAGQPDNS